MSQKQKLELTWVGKENRPRLEPRILLEDREKSYHAKARVSDRDIFDNRLIFGDNLLALKALEHEFSGKVKCIYIDPPFNTQQAFEHYDDGVEHSIWLSLMRDRIELLRNLLSTDGTFVIHIDDNELGYVIAMCDEIFGRKNRLYVVTFKQSSVSGPKSINPGIVTIGNYIVLYAKDKQSWSPNRLLQPTPRDRRYSKFIANYSEDPSRWRLVSLRDAVASDRDASRAASADDEEISEDDTYEFVLRNAERVVRTARIKDKDVNEAARVALQRSRTSKNVVHRSSREGKADLFFLNGEQLIFYKSKVQNVGGEDVAGVALSNIWDDLLSNNLHKEGGVAFPKGKKPEGLLRRIFELTSRPGDWVLDSFAGSGTTGAVAHKMKRRWIMVELGEHCDTHILPRMRRAIDGEDDSGITSAVEWKGGGGFRYFRLAPSLLLKDKWGREVINKAYNAEMLAEAVCKIEGFTYAPSETVYWQQGKSTERDFIYVTTQTLSQEKLQQLSEEVGPDRSLLILCSAFRGKPAAFQNLTVKKIPAHIVKRCEWDHDDYSLNVKNLPKEPSAPRSPGSSRRRCI
jgi:adenine-specific DNA-methyltransferase